MFDISWSEVLIIGIVALIVIGTKQLPSVLRTAGVWTRKARSIVRDFQRDVDEMVREAELKEAKQQIDSVSGRTIARDIERTIDPTGGVAQSLTLEAPVSPEAAGDARPAVAGDAGQTESVASSPDAEEKPKVQP